MNRNYQVAKLSDNEYTIGRYDKGYDAWIINDGIYGKFIWYTREEAQEAADYYNEFEGIEYLAQLKQNREKIIDEDYLTEEEIKLYELFNFEIKSDEDEKEVIYVPYELFIKLYKEAQLYDDMDWFIAERGWQEWMNDYKDDMIASILKTSYKLSRMTFSELKEFSGLSVPKLADKIGVSPRTFGKWVSGEVMPPAHDKMFLTYVMFGEELNKK